MSSSNGYVEYDLNLLAMAPPPPKGYAGPDSLQYKPPPPRRDDLESGRPQFVSYNPNTTVGSVEPKVVSTTPIPTKPSPPTERKPFYRTTKGIIIMVIAALVILAAIIGGVVGTLATKKKSDSSPQPILSSLSSVRSQGGDYSTIRITSTLSRPPSYSTTVFRVTTVVPP